MDDGSVEIFLEELSKAYPENHLLVVLDGAPSHRSEKIDHPENISLTMFAPYSPELEQAERWFQEFRLKLSNRTFESVAVLQEALTQTLLAYSTGKSLPSSNGSSDTHGGWRLWKRYDINSPDRYKMPK